MGKMSLFKKIGGLGFRDMGSFNLAMLAKQSWRILKSPSSMVNKLFQQKYFFKGEFLAAKVSYRSSHV